MMNNLPKKSKKKKNNRMIKFTKILNKFKDKLKLANRQNSQFKNNKIKKENL